MNCEEEVVAAVTCCRCAVRLQEQLAAKNKDHHEEILRLNDKCVEMRREKDKEIERLKKKADEPTSKWAAHISNRHKARADEIAAIVKRCPDDDFAIVAELKKAGIISDKTWWRDVKAHKKIQEALKVVSKAESKEGE